jgi:hypothetical protein
MDWDERLFAYLDDLEQQAETRFDVERAGELGDRARGEYAVVTLASRLMASVDRPVVLHVRGMGTVAGTLERAGADWCLVGGGTHEWVVRLAHVVAVDGASERSFPEVAWSPVTRLGVGSAFRSLADAGERCLVHTADGASYDVVVSRVGADFVEVRTGQRRTLLLPLAVIAAVRTRSVGQPPT